MQLYSRNNYVYSVSGFHRFKLITVSKNATAGIQDMLTHSKQQQQRGGACSLNFAHWQVYTQSLQQLSKTSIYVMCVCVILCSRVCVRTGALCYQSDEQGQIFIVSIVSEVCTHTHTHKHTHTHTHRAHIQDTFLVNISEDDKWTVHYELLASVCVCVCVCLSVSVWECVWVSVSRTLIDGDLFGKTKLRLLKAIKSSGWETERSECLSN